MKFLIITSIAEDLHAVSAIMEQAGIQVFSVSETVGHKTADHNYQPDNWFGRSEDGTNALVFFSFTDQEKAQSALQLVKELNAASKAAFPIRAFIMPVEQSGF